jgi:hypothetical protein
MWVMNGFKVASVSGGGGVAATGSVRGVAPSLDERRSPGIVRSG